VVRHTHSLPFKAERWGPRRAISWGRTQLRSLVGLVNLAEPPKDARRRAAVEAVAGYLTTGPLLVMCRNDRIGLALRTEFLEAVEVLMLEPTLRTVFVRSPPNSKSPYEPKTDEALPPVPPSNGGA
jgi:hypothetical protein